MRGEETGISYTRTWSDNHVDYECAMCGAAFRYAKSVASHRQWHIGRGEIPGQEIKHKPGRMRRNYNVARRAGPSHPRLLKAWSRCPKRWRPMPLLRSESWSRSARCLGSSQEVSALKAENGRLMEDNRQLAHASLSWKVTARRYGRCSANDLADSADLYAVLDGREGARVPRRVLPSCWQACYRCDHSPATASTCDDR